MSTYIQAAKSFRFGGGSDVHVGPVIVSEESIFLTRTKVLSAGAALERSAGTVGKALSKLVEKESDPFDYAVPIPEGVLNDPGWPLDPSITTAVSIQRTDAQSIKYPFWSSMCVTVNGVEFEILADFFSRKKILGLLRDSRWNVI